MRLGDERLRDFAIDIRHADIAVSRRNATIN
jgi:hypothetical protein